MSTWIVFRDFCICSRRNLIQNIFTVLICNSLQLRNKLSFGVGQAFSLKCLEDQFEICLNKTNFLPKVDRFIETGFTMEYILLSLRYARRLDE